MSHVTSVDIKVKDLAALKTAVEQLGGVFCENKKSYVWWGRSAGDYPMPEGMTAKDLGKCDHAIKVPGVNYSIGVVRKQDGTYTLAYDFYNYGEGPNGVRADGGRLHEQFGPKLKNLVQAYSQQVVIRKMRTQGWSVSSQKLSNGSIKMVCTK